MQRYGDNMNNLSLIFYRVHNSFASFYMKSQYAFARFHIHGIVLG